MKAFLHWLVPRLAGPQYRNGPLPGIRYFTGSWSDVLAEAKRQNKPVFVDFYKLGFGPREQIAREAVLNPALARTFNAHFINYWVDDQAGEGLAIAKRYRIHAYSVPASLFVLGDGSLLHRPSAYETLRGLLAEADNALKATHEPNRLSILEQDYVAGQRDPAFLATYLQERGRVGMPNNEALATYLSLMPEINWTADETVQLIIGNLTTYNQNVVNALLQKLRQLNNSSEKPSVALRTKIIECVRQLMRTRFHQAVAGRDEQQLSEVIADNALFLYAERADKLSTREAEAISNGYRRRFYAETRNFTNYRPLAEAEAWRLMAMSMDSVRERDKIAYQRYEERRQRLCTEEQRQDYQRYAQAYSSFESHDIASKLNRIVRHYLENTTDPDDLNQALTWSARSLEYDRNSGYVNLHARLLIKIGRPHEADKLLREVSAQQTPGVHSVYIAMKRPEEYER